MFYKLMYSKFIGLVEGFNTEKQQLFKESNKSSKRGIELIQTNNDTNVYTFDQMQELMMKPVAK